MINGIINIYKEAGFTSHDVVAKLRGILHQKKIGHTGTLDPDATGVLPVCLGSATKIVEFLTNEKKSYRAGLLLGKVTDTQDISGQVLEENEPVADEEEIRAAIASFIGPCMQVPPMYSAIKVNGKRLYELAREGKTVERKARPVEFFDISIVEMQLPHLVIDVTCSKGSYIRTLCHDIGAKLSCGACMESLVRTSSGSFTLDQAKTLSQVEEAVTEGRIKEWIRSVDSMFPSYEKMIVSGQEKKLVHNGNPIKLQGSDRPENGCGFRIWDDEGCFVGIYEYRASRNLLYPVKMFMDGGNNS